MEKHEKRGKYIGSASRKQANQEARTLEHAIVDAYERAIASKPDNERQTAGGEAITFRFKVVGIRIEGTNPIGDYVVDLDDD
jgi:hypothetical protein